MTYEYAVYLKLLLLCGYQDELQQYVNDALIAQDPLSDIVLSLSTAGNDGKVLLSVLNEYLRQVKDSDIDYDQTVFDLVMSFLKKTCQDGLLSQRAMTKLMYHIALYTDRYLQEPWSAMYYMDDLLDGVEAGYVKKEEFLREFEAFINNRAPFRDDPPASSKENLFKRVLRKMRGK